MYKTMAVQTQYMDSFRFENSSRTRDLATAASPAPPDPSKVEWYLIFRLILKFSRAKISQIKIVEQKVRG